MEKEFTVKCTIGVVFKSREEAYNFLIDWRSFIDKSFPVDAFDFHDISLNFRVCDNSPWSE